MTMEGVRLTPEGERRIHAAVEVAARSGAKNLEVGYLNDSNLPIYERDWYAHVDYGGTRVTVEHLAGPVEALEALALRLLTGAKCLRCGGLVTLDGATRTTVTAEQGGYMALPGQEPWTEEAAKSAPLCHWQRKGDRWRRGCGGDDKGIPADAVKIRRGRGL